MFKKQKLFYLFILILSVQSCGLLNFWKNRNHEIRESYYNDGTLEYNSSYFNNKLDGPSYYYSIHGILLSYSEYSNGSAHGIWKNFHDTGEIRYSCSYFYGNKHGEEKFYYKNGEVQSLTKYTYGDETSPIIRWNKNGELLF